MSLSSHARVVQDYVFDIEPTLRDGGCIICLIPPEDLIVPDKIAVSLHSDNNVEVQFYAQEELIDAVQTTMNLRSPAQENLSPFETLHVNMNQKSLSLTLQGLGKKALQLNYRMRAQ